VARDDFEAKFWLDPITLAASFGFRPAELRDLQRPVEEHRQTLIAA
jgi:hypothetical protein